MFQHSPLFQVIEQRGHRVVEVGAQNAALSIMVGGPADLFEEMKPILGIMGGTVTHCEGTLEFYVYFANAGDLSINPIFAEVASSTPPAASVAPRAIVVGLTRRRPHPHNTYGLTK